MTPCFSSGTQNNDILHPFFLSTSKMKNSSSFDEGGGAAPAISVVTGTPKNFSTSLHFSENPSLPGPHHGWRRRNRSRIFLQSPIRTGNHGRGHRKNSSSPKGATAADSRHFFTRTHTHIRAPRLLGSTDGPIRGLSRLPVSPVNLAAYHSSSDSGFPRRRIAPRRHFSPTNFSNTEKLATLLPVGLLFFAARNQIAATFLESCKPSLPPISTDDTQNSDFLFSHNLTFRR